MNLPEFGIKNSLFSNLVAVFLVVAGGLSVLSIQREAFPNFSFDMVSIATKYPGAGPEQVESLITNPIEDELAAVSDLDEVSSVSAEGVSLVYAKIDPDASDKTRVVDDIRQAVGKVDDFPSDLQDTPVVSELRTQDTPILEIAISGSLERAELQKWGRILEDQLKEIGEVSTVTRNGWLEEQVIVALDPARLKNFDLTLLDVANALKSRHINIPQGSLDQGAKEIFVRTNLEFTKPEDLLPVVIKSNLDGRVITVKDVARVEWGFEKATKILRANGKSAISLVVIKRARADILKMVGKVKDALNEFQTIAPKEMQFRIVNDVSVYVSNRLNILLNNGWIGIILVVLSLFLFLDRRIAFWTSMGVPVAFACGFWLMKQMDITVNLISMFGLIIVLGMLVDDSIVVAESVYQKIEGGMNRRQAAIEGSREVIIPVLMTVSTTIMFFMPLMFMSGILGKFVKPIPIVVSVTLLGSLLECFLILPSHLAAGKTQANIKENRVFVFLRSIYQPFIQRVLRFHYVVTPAAILLLLIVIAWGIKTLPIIMFPGKDIEIFFIRAKAPMGTSYEKTEKQMIELENLARQIPKDELKDVITQVGIIQQDPNDPFTERGSHVGQIAVYLTQQIHRKRLTQEIVDELRLKLKSVQGFDKIWINEVKPGPPQDKPINIRVRGNQSELALEAAKKIQDKLSQISGVQDVTNDFEQGKDEIRYNISDKMTAQVGLSPIQVSRVIRGAIEGETIGVLRDGNENKDIVVKLAPEKLNESDVLTSLSVRNNFGMAIPVSQLMTSDSGHSLNFVKHLDRKRVINVTSNVDESKSTARAISSTMSPFLKALDQEYPSLQIRSEGENKDTDESLESLKRAFILGLLACYFMLSVTFRSLIQPLLILLALPFGIASALVALYLHGEPLSFLAFLGLVGLCGVAVNDSIVLISTLNGLKKEGSDTIHRVAHGSASRVRAVLLTTITTVLGIGPIAYGIGGEDLFLKPMAIVIAWGLGFGTLLTLILIPSAYTTIEKLTGKWQQFQRKPL